MAPIPPVYFALDGLSTALTLAVAAFFAASWRRSGDPLHLLFAAGFALVGASFASASASQFNLGAVPERWDGVRLAGQLGGALVLALAYGSVGRYGRARPWLVLGAVLAVGSLTFAILYWVVPPHDALPPLRRALAPAHAVMIVAYAACAVMSAQGWHRRPTPTRALVPLAFVAWALTKYTWLLIDISQTMRLVPFVYLWRLTAVGLLLGAVAWPTEPARGEVADAPA